MIVNAGSTDVTTYFALRLAATGVEATGLTISDIDLQYVRSGVAPVAKVDAVALAATDTAHTDNRAIEIDATDQPGLYRVDWPDAAFAAGVREVICTVKVATCFTEHLRVELSPAVNVEQWNATAVPSEHTAGYPIVTIKDGTGTGEVNTNGGKVVGVELVDVLTTYTGNTVQTGDAYARLGAPAGASVSADIAAIEAQTDDIGAAGAGLTALATQASVDAIDDLLDTEMPALTTAVGAVKTQTDKLTFTVANVLDANVQRINDVAITGDGAGTPFGV